MLLKCNILWKASINTHTITYNDTHIILSACVLPVFCVASECICHTHMWPINIAIRGSLGRSLHSTNSSALELLSVPAPRCRCQHHVCIEERRITIKCDLMHDSLQLVSLCAVCAFNIFFIVFLKQLSVKINNLLFFQVFYFCPSGLCACVCHLHTMMWLMPCPSLCCGRLSDLKPLWPQNPIYKANIKLSVYFMKLMPQTFSRFTAIFMHLLVLECGHDNGGQTAGDGQRNMHT